MLHTRSKGSPSRATRSRRPSTAQLQLREARAVEIGELRVPRQGYKQVRPRSMRGTCCSQISGILATAPDSRSLVGPSSARRLELPNSWQQQALGKAVPDRSPANQPFTTRRGGPSVNGSEEVAAMIRAPARSQKRARISAVTVSSSGLPSMLAKMVRVAQRLRVSIPSSASAWAIERGPDPASAVAPSRRELDTSHVELVKIPKFATGPARRWQPASVRTLSFRRGIQAPALATSEDQTSCPNRGAACCPRPPVPPL